jgi:hypothetical protein
MLEIMKKHGHMTQFKAFISGDELIIVGFAFIDDKDLLKAAKLGEHDYEEVVIKMQEGLDLWEGLLKATGGALVPEKIGISLISSGKTDCGNTRLQTTHQPS